MRIGIISRGNYGGRLARTLAQVKGFETSSASAPDDLPDFIEDPSAILDGIDERVFKCDLLFIYTLHPDITPGVLRLAGIHGVKAAIVAGSPALAGSQREISDIAEKYGMHIEVHEICCGMEECGNEVIDEFTSKIGSPRFEITIKGGVIGKVRVVRGAPCGSTWHAAVCLAGTRVADAPAKAGLLVQQYPCRAARGTSGGIHRAAKLHSLAVDRAVRAAGTK